MVGEEPLASPTSEIAPGILRRLIVQPVSCFEGACRARHSSDPISPLTLTHCETLYFDEIDLLRMTRS